MSEANHYTAFCHLLGRSVMTEGFLRATAERLDRGELEPAMVLQRLQDAAEVLGAARREAFERYYAPSADNPAG